MTKFYSQNGEDFLLNEIFKDKTDGFFVEVGCIDGRRFSNTLAFEERGWKGMCVEAHTDYIKLLKKNRPNSIICHCAAGEKDENEVTFYANSRGSLSTLDKSQEENFKKNYGKYFEGFKEQKVSKRRLDSLFKEFKIKNIDVMSLDIEGYEAEALKGMDFNCIKPTVIIVESDNEEHQAEVEKILLPAGYHKIGKVAHNIFYSLDNGLKKNINKLFHDVELIHTEHPLDKCGDKIIKIDIDGRERSELKNKVNSAISGIFEKIGAKKK